MNAEQIREIAIDSATAYYNYLEENENRGIQEVNVHEILYLEGRDLLIKLRLSAKLFDTEAIFFRHLKNGKKYDVSEIKVVEYDGDKNILLIKPIEQVQTAFQNLTNNDIKVISDLKFLVQRVKAWYELNGAHITLPSKPSDHKLDIKNIQFFNEKEFQPSLNQHESIRNIFTEPFSYVWGAPGTGKTQFVLSYSVLHYLNKGGKIAILAPTNNSIEQVLKGVIKMTDKAGVDRKRILRLGTPSKKFAEEFSEVCEEKGVQKKLSEIDKQISILERVLIYEKSSEVLNQLISKIRLFDELSNLILTYKGDDETYSEELKKQKKKEIEIKFLKEKLIKLEEKRKHDTLKLNSFGNKLVKLFSSKPTVAENTLLLTEDKITEVQKDLEYLQYEYSGIDADVIKFKHQLSESKRRMDDQLQVLKTNFSIDTNFKSIIEDVSTKNYEDKRKEINELISNRNQNLEIDKHLFSDYQSSTLLNIREELDNYKALRTRLSISSTEERLKAVNVIACTLDGYIGRFTESKLNVQHIFLDEAGYTNIVKALTLFNHQVPISFLGDHMQLPPVCEINDSNIQTNELYRNMFLWAQSAIHLDSLFSKSRDECLNQYLNNSVFNPINISRTSLNSTFRFGNNLAEVLNTHVYQNNFSSLNPSGDTSILYVNARKAEGFKSRISISEVQAIKVIIESLNRSNNKDFVILTPYKKQIELLNKHLPQERNDLKILTVHGSQGREWDTVILSVVDTSDKWFVDSTIPVSKGLNLVNTAVSRAKKKLIIVCDKTYWGNLQGQLVSDLLQSGTEMEI